MASEARLAYNSQPGAALAPDLPGFSLSIGNYTVRLARTAEERDQALRLRFKVFNEELHEGLASAYLTGRDEDRFDASCHHLVVINQASAAVVGTYRLQTAELAAQGHGFYSASEFDLSRLAPEILGLGVELGRACIARSDRTPFVLLVLWQGLAAYLQHYAKRYLFGCCSIPGQDPVEGARVFSYLREQGHLHPRLMVAPLEPFACPMPAAAVPGADVQLPRLFRTYLRYGAQVCSAPAIDRAFKTIDFFMMLDVMLLSPHARTLFFRS